jgi:myo-inositol-1(or 4)-monophosphatase
MHADPINPHASAGKLAAPPVSPGLSLERMAHIALADAVTTLCREVGRDQLAAFRGAVADRGTCKPDGSLRSALDLASEQRLRTGLARLLPEAGFVGEETSAAGAADPVWVVDPLDGTTNFLSGLAPFAVSVALVRGAVAELGVIHAPPTGECFTAVRGAGAWRNGRPLPRAVPRPLAEAVVCVGLPVRCTGPARAALLTRLDGIWAGARDVRCLGCAAMELAYVAAGDVQGFWEAGLGPWDGAAASVLLAETGCRIADGDGAPYAPLRSRGLLAGVPGVFEALAEIVAGICADAPRPAAGALFMHGSGR